MEIVHQYGSGAKLYELMARSVAPRLYGLEDVKKLLLLQLVGGVNWESADGEELRGEIHVLLVGGTGTGKSHLLRRVSEIAPKALYATGKILAEI